MPHARYAPKHWVENDKERYRETLEQPDGTAYDLTGRVATFVLRHSDGTKIVDREADSYPDRTNGVVEIVLQESETAKAGRLEAEWVITGGTDDPTTFPKDDELTVHIREDVDASDTAVDSAADDANVNTLTLAELTGSISGSTVISDIVGEGLSIQGGALTPKIHPTYIGSAESLTVSADEHHQYTIPSDRSLDVDGTVTVDGSLVFMGV